MSGVLSKIESLKMPSSFATDGLGYSKEDVPASGSHIVNVNMYCKSTTVQECAINIVGFLVAKSNAYPDVQRFTTYFYDNFSEKLSVHLHDDRVFLNAFAESEAIAKIERIYNLALQLLIKVLKQARSNVLLGFNYEIEPSRMLATRRLVDERVEKHFFISVTAKIEVRGELLRFLKTNSSGAIDRIKQMSKGPYCLSPVLALRDPKCLH